MLNLIAIGDRIINLEAINHVEWNRQHGNGPIVGAVVTFRDGQKLTLASRGSAMLLDLLQEPPIGADGLAAWAVWMRESVSSAPNPTILVPRHRQMEIGEG